jgi:hypothetical protein
MVAATLEVRRHRQYGVGMGSRGPSGPTPDPGIRLVLQELRDLRVEMRADRHHAQQDRRRADEERRAYAQERRAYEQERQRADEEYRQERRRADERFEGLLRETRVAIKDNRAAFRDVRTVGLAIVRTLNRHTRILERIERKLGGPGGWRPGSGNGRDGDRRR